MTTKELELDLLKDRLLRIEKAEADFLESQKRFTVIVSEESEALNFPFIASPTLIYLSLTKRIAEIEKEILQDNK